MHRLPNRIDRILLSLVAGMHIDIDDYVFRNKRKNPYTSDMIGKRLRFLKTQIKKKYGVDLMYVTQYYFRHTFATRGINNGVPIKDMQELLGYANARMLMDVCRFHFKLSIN